MNDPPPLPAPEDDGAARHLPGSRLPSLELPSSDGGTVGLSKLPTPSVVFVHPGIGGHLGRDAQLEEWTALPGARGCTAEACSFRDELAAFDAAGVAVFGLSAEPAERQREHAQRLGLPYPLLSDAGLELAENPGFPTFEFDSVRYFKRLTLVIAGGSIEGALYPVFPPHQAAAQALGWLRGHPSAP